jgi:uncharacterized protein
MRSQDLGKFTGFDWDAGNRDKNWLKHKVSLAECEQAFFNQPLLLLEDTKHSAQEPRTLLLGTTDQGRLLSVIFTERGAKIRVISARDMHRNERELYRHA